jgi:hypothetical protein
MSRLQPRRITIGSVLLLGLAATASAQQPSPPLAPYSLETQRALTAQALKSPRLAEFVRAGRVRTLRVTPEEVDKDGTPRVAAAAIFVSYVTGRAVRALISPTTGEVEDVQSLPGRPQSSADERREAEQLLRDDKAVGALIKGGAGVQGGFVVDPPAGPATGRHLEFHLTSPDGAVFVAEVVVDLAARQVVQLRRAAEEGGVK